MTIDITLEVQSLQMLIILLLGLLKNYWPRPKVKLSHWQLHMVWCIEFWRENEHHVDQHLINRMTIDITLEV
jgi:hypothetical protein